MEKQQNIEIGVDTYRLKPGTKIKVTTSYSLYDFEVTEVPGYLLACGGLYLVGKQIVYFSGSTFGGSMLKIGWIGVGMRMEMWSKSYQVRVTTSNVLDVTVIGENWEYTLD